MNTRKLLIFVASLLFSVSSVQAQLLVDTTGITGPQLTNFLTGSGLTISNLVVNCDQEAMGNFTYQGQDLGMSSGLLLTTGKASFAVGPNSSGSAGIDNGTPGDPDLTVDLNAQTFNACSIEFDAVPQFNNIMFNFAFASEEYLEFVNAGVNDGFAIYVSGPSISGQTNIAYIPGTSSVVSIDSVNILSNSLWYVDNDSGVHIEYDGFTKNMLGELVAQVNQTYHFKIVVADAGDGVFDSGVFIEGNSFRSEAAATAIVEHSAIAGLSVYPNPANSVANVSFAYDHAEQGFVQIIDATGRTVYNERMAFQAGQNQITLELNDIAEGLYTLVLQGDGGSATQQLMITK